MAKKSTKPNLNFYQKLILNKYLLKKFGIDSLKDIAKELNNPELEVIDNEGRTNFYKQIIKVVGDRLEIDQFRLAQYDLNIVSHLGKINENRDETIMLKYFQYLGLLFVEYYLDEYFNNKDTLLLDLNGFIEEFNDANPNDQIQSYDESNLNKIAFWNATGSGKTILMHINYYQFIHYSRGHKIEEPSYILLTPREGLSLQHLDEFGSSNINASLYDKNDSRFLSDKAKINIIEYSRLGYKEGKDKDNKVVSVHRFEGNNCVFVDEGHRGSSGDKWHEYRNILVSEGFSFEYSATFGQSIKASKSEKLLQEYAKCIIFDYSYKYFYGDGYGKDYNIINLQEENDESRQKLYLTACLLTFYQQKKLYKDNESEFKRFKLENPLFIFVGGSVNAVSTVKGKKISDVLNILLFFNEFISRESEAISAIERIMIGRSGILNNNRDIFDKSFTYLVSTGLDAKEIYNDLLGNVFNCDVRNATFHIENLKSVPGEIRLRLGENEPFGVINVGDDTTLLKLCSDHGLNTGSIDFRESLFQTINDSKSTVNLLIGSKKFSEGWNSWRVSTMGLMNVGRSEGSEIIQLFGRGVRLKGYDMSLKRSNFVVKDRPEIRVPKYIQILETLNIFGVRADYMKQFKELLDAEGAPTDKEPPVVFELPVIRNKNYKKSGIYHLKVRDDLDYKSKGPNPSLVYDKNLGVVVLDCYAKVQFQSSNNKNSDEVVKEETTFKSINLEFLDYNQIYFDILKYKNEKGRFNVNISKNDIIKLLKNPNWYKLQIPKHELELNDFEDYKRWQKIAVALLKKYFDKFYYAEKSKWEKPLLVYTTLDDKNENFLENDEYTISISNSEENEEIISFITNFKEEVTAAKNKDSVLNFSRARSGLEAIVFEPSLYNPLLYVSKNSVEITVSPVALNESEANFIKDLKGFIENNETVFKNKKIYIIRNKSKKGIGFFESAGFYPDFVMWLVTKEKQYITFIDPHGARNMSINDYKVSLSSKIKEIETQLGDPNVILNSMIVTPTKHAELVEKHIAKEEWVKRHVFFMEDESYLDDLFTIICNN